MKSAVKYGKKIKATDFLFLCAISSFPLYLLPSGNIQIPHAFLLVFSFSYVLENRFPYGEIKRNISLLVLLVLMSIRQALYWATSNELIFTPVLFFAFNVLMFYVCVDYFNTKRKVALRMFIIATPISIAVVFIGMVLDGLSFSLIYGSTGRGMSFFNNPNQLGYFSLCILGIVSVLYLVKEIDVRMYVIYFALCVFISSISLSKAAMLSILIYLLLIIRKSNLEWKYVYTITLFGAFFLVSSYDGFEDFRLSGYEDNRVVERLGTFGKQEDDSVFGRGYGVLANLDERIVYGWGEGYVMKTAFKGEVHSTLGNILISYGVVGFALITWFFLKIVSGLIKRNSILVVFSLLAPVMMYGLVHNGIRFSIFWVYIALLSSSILSGRRLKF